MIIVHMIFMPVVQNDLDRSDLKFGIFSTLDCLGLILQWCRVP